MSDSTKVKTLANKVAMDRNLVLILAPQMVTKCGP